MGEMGAVADGSDYIASFKLTEHPFTVLATNSMDML